MAKITMKAAALLDARPEDVYTTIADYHHGHPHILPEEFSALHVEQGGYGEGTVMRFSAKTLGIERHFYQRVIEPEPGRVLVEQDIDSPQQLTTTFIVTPVEDGQKSHVEIETTMNASSGIMGVIERMMVPRMSIPVFKKELKILEKVAQKRASTG